MESIETIEGIIQNNEFDLERAFSRSLIARNFPFETLREMSNLWSQFHVLISYVQNFARALQLYVYAKAQCERSSADYARMLSPEHMMSLDLKAQHRVFNEGRNVNSSTLRFSSWSQIAARDGALNIFHFFKSRNELLKRMNSISTLKRELMRSAKKESNKILEDNFPSWEAVRNTVAHLAEFSISNDHSLSGRIDTEIVQGENVSGVFIGGVLIRDFYSVTYQGKVHGYSLSIESLIAMNESVRLLKVAIIEGLRDG